MNAAAFDIKDILESESALGLVFATNLFIAKEPDAPADCVTIFDYPNIRPALTLDRDSYFYSAVQIRIRNKRYDDGMTLAYNIRDVLHGRARETWNGTLYTLIAAMSDPFPLDFDGNNRPRIIINFNLQRR